MTKADIIIALVFIAGCLICYARGIRDGRKDERYEASLRTPRKVRKLVVVNTRSAICPNTVIAPEPWGFRPKSLSNPEPV